MSTRTLQLISLAASLLITAGLITGLAATSTSHVAAPTVDGPSVIDGMPVTDLPPVMVYPSASATVDSPHTPTVATATAGEAANHLVAGMAIQVANSHLDMPYYSFGSRSTKISKD